MGNVLVTVSDRKLQSTSDNQTVIYYTADVASATDYYPFGVSMPGRKYSSDKYRYGFNGKENDAETGTQDYGMRIYNPALGKFLSVDPLAGSYPHYTPYQFAGNQPIKFIDLDGLEEADPAADLYCDKPRIDMLGAPENTPVNAQGFPRSHRYFWRQMLSVHPEYFSPENIKLINSGYSPWVDEVWVNHFKTDESYLNNRLIHHHVEGKNLAVAIPEKLHWDKFSNLHAFLKNKWGGLKARVSMKGALGTTTNVFGIISFLNVDDPDNWLFAFGQPGNPEDRIGVVVKDDFVALL